MNHTSIDFIIKKCRKLFLDKLKDYDLSWKLLKNSSIIDQILIKIIRIKNIQSKGYQEIKEEKITDTYMDVINYIVIILIKLDIFFVLNFDKISCHDVIFLYNKKFEKIKNCIHEYSPQKIFSINNVLKNILYLKKNEEEVPFKKLEKIYFKILIETIFLLKKFDTKIFIVLFFILY
ncbi:nucleotide modification associated domain-containing protein [Blattabacterium cuenoti]|uniref:nucleotide modification associated domain-containing protein n=1 Tax=Blattabacterium cuenoti TaxID=1653831 RepID=UPI00163CE878|nr:nucleotide modification associated domain-containing protein [Blattabacterium cuenoti]